MGESNKASTYSPLIAAVGILSVCCIALSAATLALLVESRKSLNDFSSSSSAASGQAQSSPPAQASATTYPWLSLPTAPIPVVGSIQGITVVFRSDTMDADGDGQLDEFRIHHHTIQRIHQVDQTLALLFLDDGVDNFVSVDAGLVLYHRNGTAMDASAGGGYTCLVAAEWEWNDTVRSSGGMVGDGGEGSDENSTSGGNRQRRLSSALSSSEAYGAFGGCSCSFGASNFGFNSDRTLCEPC